jgi:hypothetical protein
MVDVLETSKENVDVNQIMLNPENPRLGSAIEFGGDPLPQAVLQNNLQMLAQGEQGKSDLTTPRDSFKALKASIIQMGRISTSIIIQKLDKPVDGFLYKVLEGNNRLTIYKQLHNDEQSKDNESLKWAKIPAEIITETNEKYYHQIQLTAHLVQPKPWEPFARAKYLHYIKNNPTSELDYEEIAEICGGRTRKKQIEDEINAYDLMLKWKESDKYGNSYSSAKFQHVYQYETNKLKLNPVGINDEKFLEFLDKDKIDEARHVRSLKDIWMNPKIDPDGVIKQTFLKRGSSEALIELKNLERTNENFNENDILDICKRLVSEIDKLNDFDDRKYFAQKIESLETLEETSSVLNHFIEEIKDIKKDF